MVHGTLLPGYTVEGLEQAKTEHAAAEVSEGGIFTPEISDITNCTTHDSTHCEIF